MKRPACVTVIAILSLIGSAFMLLIAVLLALVALLAPVPGPPDVPYSPAIFRAMFAGMAVFHALLAAWGITTGIGLFRLREWARISTIVFSVLLILQSAFGLLSSLFMTILSRSNQAVDPGAVAIASIIMAVLSLSTLGLGTWWLVYFIRKKVREQFASARAASPASPVLQASPEAFGQSATFSLPGPPRRPLSFTIIAWFMLVSCLFIPVSILLRSPAILLTTILVGWPATVYFIAFLVVQLYIGIGLLRRKLTARIAAIAYFCFGFVNAAIFYLAPGGHSRMLNFMRKSQEIFPWTQPLQNQQPLVFFPTSFMAIGICIGLIVISIPLYFLITRKDAYEKAAAAR